MTNNKHNMYTVYAAMMKRAAAESDEETSGYDDLMADGDLYRNILLGVGGAALAPEATVLGNKLIKKTTGKDPLAYAKDKAESSLPGMLARLLMLKRDARRLNADYVAANKAADAATLASMGDPTDDALLANKRDAVAARAAAESFADSADAAYNSLKGEVRGKHPRLAGMYDSVRGLPGRLSGLKSRLGGRLSDLKGGIGGRLSGLKSGIGGRLSGLKAKLSRGK